MTRQLEYSRDSFSPVTQRWQTFRTERGRGRGGGKKVERLYEVQERMLKEHLIDTTDASARQTPPHRHDSASSSMPLSASLLPFEAITSETF